MMEDGLSITNRRQFLVSSAIGALAGAAWGMSFLTAETKSEHPVLTLYRTSGLFSMMIDFQPARLLLLDGDDADVLSRAVESTTGFLRQRLDIVIATSQALQMLPTGFMKRWNVSAIYALPDNDRPLAEPLAGRSIAVGELRITADSIPFGAWRTAVPSGSRSWYLEIRYPGVRCLYSSSLEALRRLVPGNGSSLTLLATNDPNPGSPERIAADVIAVPSESVESTPTDADARILRLYRDYPISIRLTPGSIIVPHEFQVR